MFSLGKKIITASGIALVLVSSSALTLADSQQDLTEARQESQIMTTYALSPYLRANDLKVVVNNGKATLTGKVDEDVNKDLAKQIALSVSGIKDVDNKIIVESEYLPKTTSQSYGQIVDDATATAAVKSRLAWSKFVESQSITVTTKNGRVTLTGTVANSESKDASGRLAMATRGVISVSNQLSVTNKAVPHETTQAISDAWITTKVKSTFFYSSNVSGSDIEVNTVQGMVTLKGRVDSGAERALAIELAQNLRGVKSVNAKDLTN